MGSSYNMTLTAERTLTLSAHSEGTVPTVYVIDDDHAIRESLRFLIESINLPVRTFATAQEFLDQYEPNTTGCILLDVRMPGISGLELQEHLAAQGCILPIIFVTGHGDIPMAVRTIKAGAMDFVEKPFGDQALLERIQKAVELSAENLANRDELSTLAQRLSKLTGRERQILNLIAEGNANKSIAVMLGVAEKTIEAHRANINRKLSATCVADLVRMALMARSLNPSALALPEKRQRRPD